MTEFNATEQAYKNGYEAGKAECKKQLSTADKLLWLVENGAIIKQSSFSDCFIKFGGKKFIWDSDRPHEYPKICYSLKEAINAAYDWAKEQK